MPHSAPLNVEAILSQYDERYRPLRWEPAAGGYSGAEIIRLEAAAGEFALRVWPTNGLPPTRILGLHRLLASLFRQGVTQVAVPIPARSGSTLVTVVGRSWQLEPWMPGVADFHDNPSRTRLRAAVSCLASWHTAAATFEPTGEERRWFHCQAAAPSPAVRERADLIEHWQQTGCDAMRRSLATAERDEFHALSEQMLRLFEQVAPAVVAELSRTSQLRFRLQPCLRDIWHDHVLFSGDDVTGLIDASACRHENVATDLARLLGSLVGDDTTVWNFAIDAYQARQTLSAEERHLVGVLDRSSVLLSGLYWLERIYLSSRGVPEFERVLERLRGLLVRLETLVASI
jgi:Ser/Thr protein kinase RdoA (MazF antagonist)